MAFELNPDSQRAMCLMKFGSTPYCAENLSIRALISAGERGVGVGMGDGFLVKIGLGVEVGSGVGVSVAIGILVGIGVFVGVGNGTEPGDAVTPRKYNPSTKRIIIEPMIMYLISLNGVLYIHEAQTC